MSYLWRFPSVKFAVVLLSLLILTLNFFGIILQGWHFKVLSEQVELAQWVGGQFVRQFVQLLQIRVWVLSSILQKLWNKMKFHYHMMLDTIHNSSWGNICQFHSFPHLSHLLLLSKWICFSCLHAFSAETSKLQGKWQSFRYFGMWSTLSLLHSGIIISLICGRRGISDVILIVTIQPHFFLLLIWYLSNTW